MGGGINGTLGVYKRIVNMFYTCVQAISLSTIRYLTFVRLLGFFVLLENFHSYEDVTITAEGHFDLYVYSALMAFEQ